MPHPNTATLNDQAFALLDKDDKLGAKGIFEQVCSQDAEDAESRMMLGVIQAEMGDFAAAENYLTQALSLDKEYADAYYYLCNVLRAVGEEDRALNCLERAVELDPEFADAKTLLSGLHANKAHALTQQGNLVEAANIYQKMTAYQPESAANWFNSGIIKGQIGQYTEAEKCIREAISIDSSLVEARCVLSSFLMMQGRTEEACTHCNKAIELEPENTNAIAMAANIAKRMGDPEEAYRLLSPLLKNGVQQINIALAFAMVSKDLGRQQEAITLLENILNSGTAEADSSKINLHFNLGMLYDDIKQYKSAFTHYQKGNDLKPEVFNQVEHAQTIDRYIGTFNKEFLAQAPVSSVQIERPIFVVGMVRSGTSLVEQILASHPDVFGAGELADIYQIAIQLPAVLGAGTPYPECVSLLNQEYTNGLSQSYLDHLAQISPDAKRVVDKMPANFLYLGLIEILFPGARIIHCLRDPIDTCLSTYFQDFPSSHPYAYNLNNLVAYYKSYLKIMAHWQDVLRLPMFEIKYEDLIADQEQVSRSLVQFCGLEWDDKCLQFHENERFVRTASYDQVNRPIYNQSVARWKNYEQELEPLLAMLNKESGLT